MPSSPSMASALIASCIIHPGIISKKALLPRLLKGRSERGRGHALSAKRPPPLSRIAMEDKQSILGSVPEELKDKGSMLYSSLIYGKGGLQNLIEFIKENDPDKVTVALSSSVDTVAELELLQAPGLSFLLPQQYLKYTRIVKKFPKILLEQKVMEYEMDPLICQGDLSSYTLYNPAHEQWSKHGWLRRGLSFDEGRFSVFGYTTVAREILPQIKHCLIKNETSAAELPPFQHFINQIFLSLEESTL